MKTRLLLIFAILILGFIPACTAQPTPEYLPEGDEHDSITADTDVFIQEIIQGIVNKDYMVFTKNFDDKMIAATTAGNFDKLSATYGPLGEATKVELVNVQVVGEYYAARYQVTYPEKTLIIKVVVNSSNPRKVSGLWFE